jgi:hypothetical protein
LKKKKTSNLLFNHTNWNRSSRLSDVTFLKTPHTRVFVDREIAGLLIPQANACGVNGGNLAIESPLACGTLKVVLIAVSENNLRNYTPTCTSIGVKPIWN